MSSEKAFSFTRAGVIGGGAWGTALACVAARAGLDVTLQAREPEVVEAINNTHKNTGFLPGISLPQSISATTDMAAAVRGADMVLLVVPSQFLRAACEGLRDHVPAGVPVIICSKGIEAASGKLMGDIVAETLPGWPLAVLSGPSFAAEVAREAPCAVTLACEDDAPGGLGEALVAALATDHFRPYLSGDVVGAELCGAAKNVVAIACGISEGRGFGASARAALISRGLTEIGRLAAALGGRRESMLSLAGVGDLTLTCTSTQSRNFSFGKALGEGQTSAQFMTGRKVVVEGVANAASVTALARSRNVDMPICGAVHSILHEGGDIDLVIGSLLSPPRGAQLDQKREAAMAREPEGQRLAGES